jgi:tetratricopeptide (TPR) repeat protein
MTDSLITELAQIASLKVISRTSSIQYKLSRKSLPEISRELGADGIVEGTVQRTGNLVRVTVQLIHGPSDRHIWANRYDRDLHNVLTIQEEVARDIAEEIRVRLTAQERARLSKNRSVNPQAHDAYLKAKLFWNDRSDLHASVALFEEAITIDPNYAAAYADLANVYVVLGESPYDCMLPREANRRAKVLAQIALQLDPGIASAHTALGMAAFAFDWDLAAAERELRLAITTNPNDPAFHEWLGMLFMAQGRTKDALAEGELSLELDPVSPACHAFIAQAYYYSGDYDRAMEQAGHILKIRPQFLQGHYWLASAYVQNKMYPEAIRQFLIARKDSGDHPVALMGYGYAQARAGNFEEAQAALNELETKRKERRVPPIYFAGIYLGMNDADLAMKFLNEAYDERSDRVIYLGVEPLANFLRRDPRFQELLGHIGSRLRKFARGSTPR